ncbi:MAG: dienelactone hydrolase family protein [Blastocatellia bacterium]
MHDYAGQDHAFARVGGAHFNAAAAELANTRTLEFFVRRLPASAGV